MQTRSKARKSITEETGKEERKGVATTTRTKEKYFISIVTPTGTAVGRKITPIERAMMDSSAS
jgi:hypothetical protein